MPVASGVRLDAWNIIAPPSTAIVDVLPPWNALVSSMCSGEVALVLTVWHVTQRSVARYFPFAVSADASALGVGSFVGSAGVHWGAVGRVANVPAFALTTCATALSDRR